MKNTILDIRELLYILMKRWWVILIVTGAVLIVVLYRDNKINANLKETYSSSVKLFVGKSEVMQADYTKAELDSYNAIIEYCIEIAKANDFAENMVKNYDLESSAKSISYNLIYNINETVPILDISYSSASKKEVTTVINAVADEFQKNLQGIIANTYVTKISDIEVNTVFPKEKNSSKLGLAIGIVLSIGVILALDFVDTSIRCRNDLEEILKLPVIGTVPKEYERRAFENVGFKKKTKLKCSRSL